MHKLSTKEEAFAPREDEKTLPLIREGYDFEFTRRWFILRNQVTFSTFLPPKFDGTKPVRMIQIGVFEGMDLVWQLQHVLKHPDSRVLAIDPWMPTTKLDAEFMRGVEQRARKNLSPWRDKVQIIKGSSQEILKDIVDNNRRVHGIAPGHWDYIVIDGDHDRKPVYKDAVNAFNLVRPGGWLLFDDVHNRSYKKEHVAHGLQDFLQWYGSQVKRAWYHRYCECYEKMEPPA